MIVGEASVVVRPNMAGFESNLKQSFKRIATGAAAVFAATKVVDFFKDSIKEAREAAEVQRQTAARLKATGGVANVSAEQVGKLANRLSRLVAIDNDVIQQNANLLLTFKKVRNEVGKGNNIFDRANEAALDLAQGTGTDLRGATIQLGKALENPVKGVTALARAGTTFTDQQKEQIKTLVKSGDTLGAQKLILAEIQTQYGGAAKAAVDPSKRLTVALANLKETIGVALLPVIEKLATWLSGLLDWFSNLSPAGQTFAKVLAALAVAIAAVVAVTRIYTTVQTALNVVMALNPFVLVILGLAALGAAIVIAWKKSQTFREVVVGALRIVVGAFLNFIGTFISGAAKAFGWIPGIGPKLRKAEKEFNTFKKRVNASIDGIIDNKTVTLKLEYGFATREANKNVVGPLVSRSTAKKNFSGPVKKGDRAAGGPVSAGSLYRVNELGQEFFIPRMSGTILSANKTKSLLAGGGPQVTIQANFYGPTDASEVTRALEAIANNQLSRVLKTATRRARAGKAG